MARCPILLVGDVGKVIARGPFIEELQRKLKAAGFDPGPIDGLYGPKTGQALLAFQRARPETMADQAFAQVMGLSIASCATYRALGLSCDEVFCDIGILGAWMGSTAKAAGICAAVAMAADKGLISLRCPGGGGGGLPSLPPTTPLPGGLRVPTWALVAGGVVAASILGLVAWAVMRR